MRERKGQICPTTLTNLAFSSILLVQDKNLPVLQWQFTRRSEEDRKKGSRKLCYLKTNVANYRETQKSEEETRKKQKKEIKEGSANRIVRLFDSNGKKFLGGT